MQEGQDAEQVIGLQWLSKNQITPGVRRLPHLSGGVANEQLTIGGFFIILKANIGLGPAFPTNSHPTLRRNPMRTLNRMVIALCGTLLLSGSLMLSGCSSHPDEEQMKQLNDLKDEVASLQKDLSTKTDQKAALDKEIAEKNAKLKKCNDDQQVVKQRLQK